jgi:hypothetical protein
MEKFGSGEYSPTPSHCLTAFVNGKPTGYMCVVCGHMQKELDPIFDDLCLYCLKEWAFKNGVSRVIPTKDAIEREFALEPTQIVKKNRSEATTIIIKKK